MSANRKWKSANRKSKSANRKSESANRIMNFTNRPTESANRSVSEMCSKLKTLQKLSKFTIHYFISLEKN